MNLENLDLDRPLVFFDLEATGLNVVTDRIVQLAAIKYFPQGGEPEELNLLVNPEISIPAETTAIHGISDADVASSPTFSQLAPKLIQFFAGADLSGYNLGRYDVPLLMEEFARAGETFSVQDRRIVDVQEIFYKMEPRTLAGALRFYQNEELVDAHDALADVRATVQVLQGQLAMYAGREFIDRDGKTQPNAIVPDISTLAAFTSRPGQLDATNRLRADSNGDAVFNFGKHRDKTLKSVFAKEPSYYRWLQDRDFSIQVKQITRQVWESMQHQ